MNNNFYCKLRLDYAIAARDVNVIGTETGFLISILCWERARRCANTFADSTDTIYFSRSLALAL